MKLLLLVTATVCSVALKSQILVPFQVQQGATWNVNSPWGYKDEASNTIIQPVNERMSQFFNGYCVLWRDKRAGVMDRTGKIVLPVIYKDCSDAQGNYVLVRDSTANDSYIIDLITKQPLRELPKNAKLRLSGLPGFFIIETSRLADRNAILIDDKTKRVGLINPKGTVILEPIYKSIYQSEDNFLKVTDTLDNYGFINAKGKWVLTPSYKSVGRITERRAFFRTAERKYGFIDDGGKVLVKPEYDNVYDYQNGYAFVTLNKENFLLDKKGKPLFRGRGYKSITAIGGNLFRVTAANDSLYLVNESGKQLNLYGAKYLASFDGSSILYGTAGKLFIQSGNDVKPFPLENVSGVTTTSTGFYRIYARITASKDSYTLLTKDLTTAISQDKVLSYSEDPLLGLTYKYVYPNDGSPMIMWSYINKAGREYSEIRGSR